MTKLLKIDFHYDRLFQKYETDYRVETVIMLMTRSRKLYNAIEMILTIIKLIEKLKTVDSSFLDDSGKNDGPESVRGANSSPLGLRSSSPASRRFNKNPALVKNLKARIRCHIKAFLSQHTLFPVQFKFGGYDMLSLLRGPKGGDPTRAESHLTGESRIINLQVGGSRRGSRSGSI